MTFSDRERLSRLADTFALNFRLTNMYAQYLERYPELITEEMIAELTVDSDITAKEAVVAILSEAFGLDDARGGDERRLIRDYIAPSVRILDAKRYTENPYYTKVAKRAIADGGISEGDWELKWEYYPPYRAAICDDMVIREDFSEYAPIGFFTEGFRFPAVLERKNEWMTLTPVDVDTCEEAINVARGRVITFGLGLGYYTYMVSEKADVESVTVVERSEDVIKLFKKHVLPHFSHPEKVHIINEDAFLYAEKIMPTAGFDYAFADTWRDASDGLAMYEKMKALEHLSRGTKFDYWIENFLISRKRALRFAELYEKHRSDAQDAPKSYAEFIERLIK